MASDLEKRLFLEIASLCRCKPTEVVWPVIVNVLANVHAMHCQDRKTAEAMWDDTMAQGKQALMMQFDQVTGKRIAGRIIRP